MSSQRGSQLGPTGMPQSMKNRVMESAANIDVGRQESIPSRPPYSSGGAYQERPFVNPSNSLYPRAQHPPVSAAGSRKGSLTSTSSAMSRFFRKGPRTRDEKDFEGDEVIDSGNEVFFDDLSHIRDRGRYGMNPDSSLDSTPLIPTLASRPNAVNGKMSNTQWRKQQLASRKAQFSGASQQPNSPRAMSFQNSPRAMSVNSRTPGMYEQRAQSMRMGEAPPLQGLGIPLNNHSNPEFSSSPPIGGPRAMSLNTPYRSSPLSRDVPPHMVNPANPQRMPYQDRRFPQGMMPRRSPNPGFKGRNDPRFSYDPRANSLASVSEIHLPETHEGGCLVAQPTQPTKQDIIGDKILNSKGFSSMPKLEPAASMVSKRKSVRRINFSDSENEQEQEEEEEENPIDFSPNRSGRHEQSQPRNKFPSPIKSDISSSNLSTYTAYTSQDARYSMLESQKSAEGSPPKDISFKISGPDNDVTEDSGSHRSSFETIGQPSPASPPPSLSSEDEAYGSQDVITLKEVERTESFKSGATSLERTSSSSSIVSKSRNLMRRFSFGQKKMHNKEPLTKMELAEKGKTTKLVNNTPIIVEPKVNYKEADSRKKERKRTTQAIISAPKSQLPPIHGRSSLDSKPQKAAPPQTLPPKPASLPLNEKACDEAISDTASMRARVSTFVGPTSSKKLNFSPETWGVFQSNAALMKELHLVSMELAESIGRECQLEKQLSPQEASQGASYSIDQQQSRQKSGEISSLMDQLNEERQKRCVAELQAHAWETGITPSSLELGYINSRLVMELEAERQKNAEKSARIEDLQKSTPQSKSKMDQLIRENQTYVNVTIPEYKNKISLLENRKDISSLEEKVKALRLENESLKQQVESTVGNSYETQRNELREALSSFREKSEIEMRLVQEKVKNLESRNTKLVDHNNQLSARLFGDTSSMGSPHIRVATSFENLASRRRAES